MYIIELVGENGTHFMVKKAFRTQEKAFDYAKTLDGIYVGYNKPLEKVISKVISKVELV